MTRLLLQLVVLQSILLAAVSGLFFSKKAVRHPTKYLLQQKVLTIGSSYTVKDDKGKAVYRIKFKRFGLGKHLKLTDASGKKEIYNIKHMFRPLTSSATYEIRQDEKILAVVKHKMSVGSGKKFMVKSVLGDFTIDGNIGSREFKITRGLQLAATISKKFFTIGDKYGVQIEEGQDVPFILAITIVIDEVAHP